MSQRLVGFDPNWHPRSFIDQSKLPTAPNRFAGMNPMGQQYANAQRDGARYRNGLGMPTAYANAVNAYNAVLPAGIRATNQKLGMNYLAQAPENYGLSRLWSTGNRGPTGVHVRAPIANGDMVSVPAAKFTRDGKIASPEEAAYALRNAELIQGGFGPLEGLLGVAGFGLGLPGGLLSSFIGKLPAGLQTAAKVLGGIKSGADLVTSKGRSGAGTILSGIGAGYRA